MRISSESPGTVHRDRIFCCKILPVFKRLIKMTMTLAFILLGIAAAAVVIPRLVTAAYSLSRIYSTETSPTRPVAIVFGAGLRRDGTPTTVLRDRVETAVELYNQGKVSKLLMSGDNRFEYYNEPKAMRQYALQLGIPDEDIVMDYAGRRTYDTCYRAGAIFGVKKAVLVTQLFHLPRAIYTCNNLGVEAVGVKADRAYYRKITRFFWNVRELPATLTAMVEVHLTRPLPVLGEPEPIFPEVSAK
jgi:vancomycin permeability regulator SanA